MQKGSLDCSYFLLIWIPCNLAGLTSSSSTVMALFLPLFKMYKMALS